jgi:hypothetical protein
MVFPHEPRQPAVPGSSSCAGTSATTAPGASALVSPGTVSGLSMKEPADGSGRPSLPGTAGGTPGIPRARGSRPRVRPGCMSGPLWLLPVLPVAWGEGGVMISRYRRDDRC